MMYMHPEVTLCVHKSFGLSCENADDWRLRIKGATGYPRVAWKMAVKI